MVLPTIFYIGFNKGFIEFKGLSRVNAFEKYKQGETREMDGLEKNFAPLFLNIENFYLYRNYGNTIPFYIKTHCIYFLTNLTQMTAVFTNLHFWSF